jgi:hypothetical protein
MSDDSAPVLGVKDFGVVAFRTVDRGQHGIMLTAKLESDEVLHLGFTAEQAETLKRDLEENIPFAKRRDA